jgi:hypothetical protein
VKPEGKRTLGRTRLDGMIILRWIFMTWDVEIWTASSWQRIGAGECDNEPSGSIKCREFLN